MKKLLTIILAVSLLLPAIALADLPDVTAYTDQELKDLISACSAELRARNTEEPAGTLVFEHEGVKLYQTGNPRFSSDYMYIPVSIYNDLDSQVNLIPNNAKINGWEVFSNGILVGAKAKKKGEITFDVAAGEVSKLDEIESLRFSWVIFNQDTWDFIFEGEEDEYRFW